MSIFETAKKFVDSLPNIVEESIKEAFTRYDFVVIDYIKNKQLFTKGQDKDGEEIQSRFLPKGTAYARLTVKLKQQKGDPYDRVTWRDTGKLYDSMRLSVGDREVSLIITVDYFKKLEFRYGTDVIGVQRQYLEEFTENYILPIITKNINDTITRL